MKNSNAIAANIYRGFFGLMAVYGVISPKYGTEDFLRICALVFVIEMAALTFASVGSIHRDEV